MSGLPIGSIQHPEGQERLSWRDSVTSTVAYSSETADLYKDTIIRCRNENCTADAPKDYLDAAGDYYQQTLTTFDETVEVGHIRAYDYSEVWIEAATVNHVIKRYDQGRVVFTGGTSYEILGVPVPQPGPVFDINNIGVASIGTLPFTVKIVNHVVTGLDHLYVCQNFESTPDYTSTADLYTGSGFFFGEPSAPRGAPP
jgi:hypothetical protein